jgi:hypothetical protein
MEHFKVVAGLSVGVLADENNMICSFNMRCDKCGQQMTSDNWHGLGIEMLLHFTSQCPMVSMRGIRATGEEN